MEYAIRTDSLCKSFGEIAALTDINLAIPTGRIVGIIGPNGAGKTTLLRALSGLIDYEGQVSVLGLEPKFQRPALMQAMDVIHDVPVLLPWMNPRTDWISCSGKSCIHQFLKIITLMIGATFFGSTLHL